MYIKLPKGADVVLLTEGNIIGCDTAGCRTRKGSGDLACQYDLYAGTGDPL